MIATAAMWHAIGRMHAAECEHGEIDMDGTIPLYITLGPLLLDGFAFLWISRGLAGA